MYVLYGVFVVFLNKKAATITELMCNLTHLNQKTELNLSKTYELGRDTNAGCRKLLYMIDTGVPPTISNAPKYTV